MAGVFEYGKNMFLGAVLGNQSVPATLQIGLLMDSPDNDDDTLAEPAGAGYTRMVVSNDSSFWTSASNGLIFSTQPLYFPTASDDWGLITHYGIFDGNNGFGIMWGEFSEPIYVAQDQAVVIDAGMLSISADAPEVSIVL